MRKMTFTLCVVLLFTWVSVQAATQEAKGITAYQEIADLALDGSANVTTNITLMGWDSDKIDLPLSYAKPENIGAEAGDLKVAAAAGKTGDTNVIKLQFNGKPPAEVKIKITFAVNKFLDWGKAKTPRGIYNLSYSFTNTTATNIGKYEFKVILPPGYVMNGVSSSTPRATGEEVELPYDFSAQNNRIVVNLRSPTMAPGKNAAIALGFKKEDLNPWPLIGIGILISLVAMYLKRDVLTSADYVAKTAA
jgi:hypothetical protein